MRVLVILMCCAASMGRANDSTIGFDNSELVLMTNDSVLLVREDLFLSPDLITVDYVFENLTNEDVELTLGFPIEQNWTEDTDSSMVLPSGLTEDTAHGAKPRDFNFKTEFNGQILPNKYQLLPMKDGKSLQALFDELELEPFRRPVWEYDEYAGEKAAVLKQNGLFEDGYPSWEKTHFFVWEAIFPAGERVNVHHEYRPSVGGSFGAPLEYVSERYCMDADFIRALERRFEAQGTNFRLESELSYLLGPGRNWAGSIGELNVTVDKRGTNSLVSLCADGVEKIAPTQFRFQLLDYEPQVDERIEVIFNSFPKLD